AACQLRAACQLCVGGTEVCTGCCTAHDVATHARARSGCRTAGRADDASVVVGSVVVGGEL
ncbi:MAG: hypothetical protein ACYCW6_17470, partial [Candidatus Xenobia bacterium]